MRSPSLLLIEVGQNELEGLKTTQLKMPLNDLTYCIRYDLDWN